MVRLLPILLLAACSVVLDEDRHSGNDGGLLRDVMLRDATAEIPRGELCAIIARPYCRARESCCEGVTSTDTERCMNEFTGNCAVTLGTWVLRDELGYSASGAQAVLDRFNEANDPPGTCDVETILDLIAYDLLDVIAGSLPTDAECTPEFSAPVNLFPVVSCLDPDVCLSDGLFGTWRCGTPRGDGGSCVTALECERGLRCSTTDFTCSPQLPDGMACLTSVDCQSLFCRKISGPDEATCGQDGVTCECGVATVDEVFCGPFLKFPELPDGMLD